jgi:hypothetical protein
MKKLMIMGGLSGFMIATILGLMKEVTWPALFLRASVAALVSGLLFRWWARLWIQSLKDSWSQRLSASTPTRPTPLGATK